MKKRRFWTGDEIKRPIKGIHDNCVFCFGSNPEGRHGLGAANTAFKYWGAVYYQGRGRQGKSYALVTKNLTKNYVERSTGLAYENSGYRSVPTEWIKKNILELYEHCLENQHELFLIPFNLNRNLNGYSTRVIIDLFIKNVEVPINCVFHESWKAHFSSK